MYWTTAVPLGLSMLHVAIAHDEAAVTNAARIAALALLMEAMSNSDLHGISIAIATPTIAALMAGVGFEIMHGASHKVVERRKAEDVARWREVQREALQQDAYRLLATRLLVSHYDGTATARR